MAVLRSLGDLFFKISPDLSSFASQLEAGIGVAAGSTAATVGVAFEALGKSMLKKFTLPLAIGLAANIAQFQALDREIRSTITLLGTAPAIVDEVFDEFSGSIARVSTEIGGLERDIADGLYQAISAGVPRDGIEDFLNIAQMAAIADKTADLTTSVDGITTAINAFSMEGLTAGRAADIMFATVAKGKTTFGELSKAMGRSAGLAANAGVKFEEFAAIIGTITLSGFQTSEAVSFLRAAITGLLRPTEEMDKVFQDIGFSTAEAAIPVIGLQNAFQAVVDAAGGSTSELQQLIGTAEGVSAILGVTGANADKFAGVMQGVANSAGATVTAFDIAEGGIGRAFGRMTEAFDRLGNRFGAIGSEIAAPFVDIITGIVDQMIATFEFLAPIIDTVVDAFKGLAKVLTAPGIKQVVGTLAAVVISLGAILGLLGPIVFVMGLLVKTFATLRALVALFALWTGSVKVLAPVLAGFAGIWQRLLALIGRAFPAAIKTAEVATVGFAANVSKLQLSLGAVGLALLAITVAVGIGIAVYQDYQKAMQQLRAETLITAEGVDRLADSLGVNLSAALSILKPDELVSELSPTFKLKNAALLNKLVEVMDALGPEGTRDYVLGIAMQFKERGATSEEIEALIFQLEGILGVDFEINVALITDQAHFDFLLAQIAFVEGKFADILNPDTGVPQVPKALEAELKQLADQMDVLFAARDFKGFAEGLEAVRPLIEGNADAMDFFSDSVLKNLEVSTGFDLGQGFRARFFNPNENRTDIDEIFSIAEDRIAGFSAAAGRDVKFPFEDGIERINVDLQDAIDRKNQLERPPEFTAEQRTVFQELAGGVEEAFDNARSSIESAYDSIIEGSLAAAPFLDIYGGPTKQSLDDLIEGNETFVSNLLDIEAVRARLVADKSDLLPRFDEASISDKAWLAALNIEGQDAALTSMQEVFDAAVEHGQATVLQDQESILAGVSTQLEADLLALQLTAGEAGGLVGTEFDTKLNAAAAAWPVTAGLWFDETLAAIAGATGGTISGPSISAIITINNNNVRVGAAPPNAGVDPNVRRGLQSVEGAS